MGPFGQPEKDQQLKLIIRINKYSVIQWIQRWLFYISEKINNIDLGIQSNSHLELEYLSFLSYLVLSALSELESCFLKTEEAGRHKEDEDEERVVIVTNLCDAAALLGLNKRWDLECKNIETCK